MELVDWITLGLIISLLTFYAWAWWQEYRKRKAYARLIRNGWIDPH